MKTKMSAELKPYWIASVFRQLICLSLFKLIVIFYFFFKLLPLTFFRAQETAQQVKVPAARSNELSLIAESHTVEDENQLPHVVFWPLCACCGTFVIPQPPPHTQMKSM